MRGQANLHMGQDGKGLAGQSIINFVNDANIERFQGFSKSCRRSSPRRAASST